MDEKDTDLKSEIYDILIEYLSNSEASDVSFKIIKRIIENRKKRLNDKKNSELKNDN